MLSAEEDLPNARPFLVQLQDIEGSNKFIIPLTTSEVHQGYFCALFYNREDPEGILDLSAPGDFKGLFFAQLEDADSCRMVRVYDQFDIDAEVVIAKNGTVTIGKPELLLPFIQDSDAAPEDFTVRLPKYSILHKSNDSIVLTMSGAFVNLLMSGTSTSLISQAILKEVNLIVPPAVMLANDFYQKTQTAGSAGGGSTGNPTSSIALKQIKTPFQQLLEKIRGPRPATAFEEKEQKEFKLLQPFLLICLGDVDRCREVIGDDLNIAASNISALIQAVLPSHLRRLFAFNDGGIKQWTSQNWVTTLIGKQSSASTGIVSGLTPACFQEPVMSLDRVADTLHVSPFTHTKGIENSLTCCRDSLNYIAFGEESPDDSFWTDVFSKPLSQLTSKADGNINTNISIPVLVPFVNEMMERFGKVFKLEIPKGGINKAELLRQFKRVMIIDVAAANKKELSKDPRDVQFSNKFIKPTVTEKTSVNNQQHNPKGKLGNGVGAGDKKRKIEDVVVKDKKNPFVAGDKKPKASPIGEQFCIPHFANLMELGNPCKKKDHSNGKKCARIHVVGPASGGAWDTSVLDALQNVLENHYRKGDLQTNLLLAISENR